MKALLLALALALPARAQEVVFLVRHAEKVDDSKDAALSERGEARARALAGRLRDAGITAIWATELRRTQQTARPLAGALKLAVKIHPAGDSRGLVRLLRRERRPLVVGHGDTLPEIAAAYGVKLSLSDGEWDALYVLVPRTKTLIHLHQD